jgi:hypothetical protein
MTGTAAQPYPGPAYPPWWTVSESYVHQDKTVVKGQPLTIEGRRGSFTFVNHTVAPPRPGSGLRTTREWVTVIGDDGFHAFRPALIRRILPLPKPKQAPKQAKAR